MATIAKPPREAPAEAPAPAPDGEALDGPAAVPAAVPAAMPPAAGTPAAGGRHLALSDVAQVAGAAAGIAAIIYVVGGMVMWLRFHKAGLPPDQAVAMMDRQQLAVIGMRLMILPAVLTGVFAWLITRRTGTAAPGAAGRGRRRRAAAKALLAAGGLVVALMLPLSFASATWIVAALVILGHVCLERGDASSRTAWQRRRKPPRRLVTILLVVSVAAFVSLGRQLDQPVQLPSASVDVRGEPHAIDGTYISASANEVMLGLDSEIVAIPRSRIVRVALGRPKDRGPSASIMSRLFGGGRYAITPFEWWCDGERYSWGELPQVCKTQPIIRNSSINLDGPGAPVEVRCPPEARRACRGWLTLETEQRYMLGPKALPRPLRFTTPLVSARAGLKEPPRIERSFTAQVCVPIDANRRGLLRRPAAGEPPYTRIPADAERPGSLRGGPGVGHVPRIVRVAFRLVVSNDKGGTDVLHQRRFTLNVPGPGARLTAWGDCSRSPAVA